MGSAEILPRVLASPAVYWSLGWCLFVATLGLAFLPLLKPSSSRWRWAAHPALFALIVTLLFIAMRWPTWVAGRAMNPDEAHMIAGAITLKEYPVFWRDVDGTTHGPLADYVLLLLPTFGLKLDFMGARLIGTLLQAATLLLTWQAGRRLLDEASARIGILPAVLLWSMTSFWDFFQYSSELVAVCLLALGGAFGACALTDERPSTRRLRLAAAAFVLGLVPYAKLQGVPLALVVGVLVFIATWGITTRSRRYRLIDTGCLLLGAILPTLVLGCLLAARGLVGVFYDSYWRSNLVYASDRLMPYSAQFRQLVEFLRGGPGSLPYFATVLGAGIVLFVPAMLSPKRRYVGIGWLIMATAFYVVIAPGRPYMHYLHFMVAPGAMLLATSLYAARAGMSFLPQRVNAGLTALLGALSLWPGLDFQRTTSHPYVQETIAITPIDTEVSRYLDERRAPGDRLAVWGWRPELYVATGMPQATRDAQTSRMIEPGPMLTYYRERFLVDILRNRPRWLVDAVGPGNFAYEDRTKQGHEIFPALAEIISADYIIVAEREGCRIYERKSDN